MPEQNQAALASLIISIIILIIVIILIVIVCANCGNSSNNANNQPIIQNPRALAAAAMYKKNNFSCCSTVGEEMDACEDCIWDEISGWI